MKKLTLYFDFCDWIGIDLKEYLLAQKGVNEVTINTEKNYVSITYDGEKTSANIIKYEILFCVNSLKFPSILAFDKHESNVEKYTITIEDACCEYCFKGVIEDLLMTPGINSAYSDFDFINLYNIKIDITYQSDLISKEEIINLEKNFNTY